ncbi:MAG: hypothetical protein EOO76_07530, partial [Novosphingobium sp.]
MAADVRTAARRLNLTLAAVRAATSGGKRVVAAGGSALVCTAYAQCEALCATLDPSAAASFTQHDPQARGGVAGRSAAAALQPSGVVMLDGLLCASTRGSGTHSSNAAAVDVSLYATSPGDGTPRMDGSAHLRGAEPPVVAISLHEDGDATEAPPPRTHTPPPLPTTPEQERTQPLDMVFMSSVPVVVVWGPLEALGATHALRIVPDAPYAHPALARAPSQLLTPATTDDALQRAGLPLRVHATRAQAAAAATAAAATQSALPPRAGMWLASTAGASTRPPELDVVDVMSVLGQACVSAQCDGAPRTRALSAVGFALPGVRC